MLLVCSISDMTSGMSAGEFEHEHLRAVSAAAVRADVDRERLPFAVATPLYEKTFFFHLSKFSSPSSLLLSHQVLYQR